MISLKSRVLLAGFAGMLSLSACYAEDTAKVSVNGTPISESLVNLLVKERTAQGQPDSPELRHAIRDNLVTLEVMSQEAKKRGLDKDPDVAAQLHLATQSMLQRAYLNDYIKNHPISESAVKAEYDRIKTIMGDKEFQTRVIAVPSEKDAQAIIAQLKKGTKFEQLAKDKSIDTDSKKRGGEIGWQTPASLGGPIGQALAKLSKGQISDPINLGNAWGVIKIDDTRPYKAPAFDSVKGDLRQRLEQQEIQSVVADLRKQAKIEGADK